MDAGRLTEKSGVDADDWLDEFDFELDPERIALRPVSPRTAARLLVATRRAEADSTIAELPVWLRQGDLLVFNDTKVLPARIVGERVRADVRDPVEATLLKDLGHGRWRLLAKRLRRFAPGDRLEFGDGLRAVVEAVEGGAATVAFSSEGDAFREALAEVGEMPLPPYIARRRAPDDRDRADYQTVFARRPGAVAAPTAGLHFDEELLRRLHSRGVRTAVVTLHVGGATFLPVRASRAEEHRMEPEWGSITESAAKSIAAARAGGGRVIAVGTTTLRLLESAVSAAGQASAWSGHTTLFIRPGHRFRAVDALFTNFHLPRSTLFMLVGAFLGVERMRDLYARAQTRKYRFYSYGDACLLLRDPE